jgi:hypothetical protein
LPAVDERGQSRTQAWLTPRLPSSRDTPGHVGSNPVIQPLVAPGWHQGRRQSCPFGHPQALTQTSRLRMRLQPTRLLFYASSCSSLLREARRPIRMSLVVSECRPRRPSPHCGQLGHCNESAGTAP